jgi:hypothetical protein
MEKRIIRLAVSLMIFFFSPAHAFTLTFENNTDRTGCDYKNFAVPRANFPYAACMNACGLDSTCQAWNFDPTSGTPLCFLKKLCPSTKSAQWRRWRREDSGHNERLRKRY